MFSCKINPDIEIIQGTLYIRNEPVNRYVIKKEIGRGANGVVFHATRKYLNQPCALKIWLRLKANDTRDKLEQGLYEAQKMAKAHPSYVATIFDADQVNGYFYITMEYIDGKNIQTIINQKNISKSYLWILAQNYIQGINTITTPEITHGDAHLKNVMLCNVPSINGENKQLLKFIDFGTSNFTNKNNSRNRHWRIVKESFYKILKPFDSLDYHRKYLEHSFGDPLQLEDIVKIGFFKDILDGLEIEASKDHL